MGLFKTKKQTKTKDLLCYTFFSVFKICIVLPLQSTVSRVDNTLQTSGQKQCDKEKDKGHRLVAKPFSGEQCSSCSEKKKQQWSVSVKALEGSSGLA